MKNMFAITWQIFYQSEFIDYLYRIRALTEYYEISLLSREPIDQEEPLTDKVKYKSNNTDGTSKAEMLNYQYAAYRLIKC